MIKIGITGSIASGKTTVSKILSHKRGPLFSADIEVKKIYNNSNFKKLITKKFNIETKSKSKSNLKFWLKNKILKDKSNIKKILFYEVPLLIENKLMKYFDAIIKKKEKKKIRLKRFKSKGGDQKFFEILNNKQLSESKKIKYCDHLIVNDKNLHILKKKLSSIINLYV